MAFGLARPVTIGAAMAACFVSAGISPALAQTVSGPNAARQVAVIPPRPYPPLGAPPSVIVPPRGADGVRRTVNAGLSPAQAVTNLRSAYNVAALNCLRPVHSDILVGYRVFLKTHAGALAASNRTVDAEFRARYGAGFARARETHLTQVYNYFANPTTLSGFCDAALEMSRASQSVPPDRLQAFSVAELAKLEAVFEGFFSAYEQYRVDVAGWDARYGPLASRVGSPAGAGASARRQR